MMKFKSRRFRGKKRYGRRRSRSRVNRVVTVARGGIRL